jgi:hypothetical protein
LQLDLSAADRVRYPDAGSEDAPAAQESRPAGTGMIEPNDQPNGAHTRTNGRTRRPAADHIEHEGAHPTALALLAPAGEPPAPPSGAVLHPPVPSDPAARRWFLAQLGSELRLAGRMYFDPRYRISRTAQFLLPAILVLFGLNYFLFSVWFAIPVVSPVLERVGCVLLGVFAYKVIARELARYRDVLAYLAHYAPR